MTSKITDADLEQVVEAWESSGRNTMAAARAMNFSRSKMEHWLHMARIRGIVTDDAEQNESVPAAEAVSLEALRRLLREGKHGLDGLSEALRASRGQALDGIDALRGSGYSIHESAGRYWLDTSPQAATDSGGESPTYTSREDDSYVFGFTSDNHLGSKYTRLDVLDRLFDRFKEIGVDRVLHAGNWIEGEGHDNRHDLTHHGMHQQCSFLAERWPQVPGLVTYAVAGNDHEGWYAKREGIHIGRYAEQCFRDAGRADWVDLGYMECDIALVNANTGVRTRLRVAHPGGGSAYAHSYAPQKYMESLSSGEKPAVVLLGHWHKMSCNNIRGSWVIQTGCTQDQTPWARQKKLDYHVGGGICRLVQDRDTGAITSCIVEMKTFFNQEYYGSGRWSPHGKVRPAEREMTF